MTCSICGYEWKPRVASPKECPQCKSRSWHKTPAAVAHVPEPIPDPPKPKERGRMPAEEFFALPYSDQMRLRREGKAPQ